MATGYDVFETHHTSGLDRPLVPQSEQQPRQRARRSYVKIVLRTLGLHIANRLGRWRGPERSKIAIHHSRSVAIARACIHLVPVTACLIILGYNFRITFVTYNSGYTALQYVAKLHEVLMQGSIAAIVLGYIRHRLVHGIPLPLGILFAATQVQSVASIFSLELWGAVTAPFLDTWQRFTFSIFILSNIILAASVGPSSAILIIPRAIQPHYKFLHVYVNETIAFPSQLGTGYLGSPNWAAAEQIFSPDVDTIHWIATGSDPSLISNISYDTTVSDNIWHYTACSPSKAIDDVISTAYMFDPIWWSNVSNPSQFESGIIFNYHTRQPCVQAHCSLTDLIGINSPFIGKEIMDYDKSFNVNLTEGAFLDSYNGTQDSHLIWLPVPTPLRNNYSILAVFAPSYSGYAPDTRPWKCGLQAAWLPADITKLLPQSGEVYLNSVVPPEIRKAAVDNQEPIVEASMEPILPIGVEWMIASTALPLNHTAYDSNSDPTIQDILHRLDTSILNSPRNDPFADEDYVYAPTTRKLTAMLATVVASAMATPDEDIQDIYSLAQMNSSTAGPDFTKINVDIHTPGVGYAIHVAPEILSAVVLCLYCALALGYTGWSIWTGLSSNSWDSVAELVALALNSRRPEHMEHTSAGIETLDIFREPIEILENDQESVELAFKNNKRSETLYKRITRNKAY